VNAFSAPARPFRQRLGAWVPLLTLAVVVLGAEAGGEAARLLFRYDRAGLETGELWRALTAHVVHLGWLHAVMNLAALGIIRLLIAEAFSPADWVGASAASALGIVAGLYYLSPEIEWYVGLSGVLHGLLGAGAIALRRSAPGFAGLLAVGLAAKLLLEQASGPLPLTESAAGGPVVVEAHLYGAIAGVAYGTFRSASRYWRARL